MDVTTCVVLSGPCLSGHRAEMALALVVLDDPQSKGEGEPASEALEYRKENVVQGTQVVSCDSCHKK